jgi:hypothetical protein
VPGLRRRAPASRGARGARRRTRPGGAVPLHARRPRCLARAARAARGGHAARGAPAGGSARASRPPSASASTT